VNDEIRGTGSGLKDSVMTTAKELDRVRFVRHNNKEVLLVDLSSCSPAEVDRLVRIVPVIVTAQPLHSVLILTDFTGSSFDEEALRAIKETAVFDKAHVKKSALVGTSSLPHGFYDVMKNYARRDFSKFNTREDAVTWLTAE